MHQLKVTENFEVWGEADKLTDLSNFQHLQPFSADLSSSGWVQTQSKSCWDRLGSAENDSTAPSRSQHLFRTIADLKVAKRCWDVLRSAR
jgi:hypothetical protein